MNRRALVQSGLAIAAMAGAGAVRAQNAELVVGSTMSGPPFSYREGSGYAGYDLELWDLIAKGMGRSYRVQSMEFAALIPALQTKNIDVVTAQLFIRPERQQVIDFSDPYYQSGLLAAVRIDNQSIGTPADLAGKVIGVETGTVAVDFVKRNVRDAKVEQLSDINAVLLSLEAGRIDAVVYDAPKLNIYAERAGKGKVRVVGPKLYSVDVGLGLQKGSPLVEPINRQLAAMKADGRIDALKKKYFGE